MLLISGTYNFDPRSKAHNILSCRNMKIDQPFWASPNMGLLLPTQSTANLKSVRSAHPHHFLACWSARRPPTTLVPRLDPSAPTHSFPSPTSSVHSWTRCIPSAPWRLYPLPSSPPAAVPCASVFTAGPGGSGLPGEVGLCKGLNQTRQGE